MRVSCLRYVARHDLVEMLIGRSRLADVQMLNFFNAQLEKECATDAMDTTKTPAPTSTPAEMAAAAALPINTHARPRRDALATLMKEVKEVRHIASEKGASGWLKVAYGADEWSSAYTSHRVVHATPNNNNNSFHVSGIALAAGSVPTGKTMPTSVQVVAEVVDATSSDKKTTSAASSPSLVVLTVRLNQPNVSANLVNGVLQVKMKKADAERTDNNNNNNIAATPTDIAVRHHVLTAAAYSGILGKLEQICALHATHATKYDAVLLRNPACQRRLAELSCYRFGLDALIDYVVGDVEEVEEATTTTTTTDGATSSSSSSSSTTTHTNISPLLDAPLTESAILSIFAERSLMDGLDDAWDLVRDQPLHVATPHRSNTNKIIEYPYIHQVLHSPKYAITSMDGALEVQALEFVAPLLQHRAELRGGAQRANTSAIFPVQLDRLFGMKSAMAPHLAATHVNLKMAGVALEKDIAALLDLVDAQHRNRHDPSVIIAVGEYMSEVFATLAVLYRCTASLNYDEDGRGHREWLLTQTFCASSAVRRAKIRSDLAMALAATKVLRKADDLDNYSVHPVELMNSAAAKKTKKAAAAASS